MSSELLDRLKNKKPPKTQKQVPIFVSNKPVQIIDKTDSQDFNKDEFMKKIRGVKKVRRKTDEFTQQPRIVEEEEEEQPRIVEEEEEEQPRIVEEEEEERPIVEEKKRKKRKRKIKKRKKRKKRKKVKRKIKK